MNSENAEMDDKSKKKFKPSKGYYLSEEILQKGMMRIFLETKEGREVKAQFPLFQAMDLNKGLFNHLVPFDHGLGIHLWDFKGETRYQVLEPGNKYVFEIDLTSIDKLEKEKDDKQKNV